MSKRKIIVIVAAIVVVAIAGVTCSQVYTYNYPVLQFNQPKSQPNSGNYIGSFLAALPIPTGIGCSADVNEKLSMISNDVNNVHNEVSSLYTTPYNIDVELAEHDGALFVFYSGYATDPETGEKVDYNKNFTYSFGTLGRIEITE